MKLRTNTNNPFGGIPARSPYPRPLTILATVLGALLGTQNGREVDIVNTFELAVEGDGRSIDHAFFTHRRDQCGS